MAEPIANLWDDFNSGAIDTAKWAVSGAWSASTGAACATMPSGGSSLTSVSAYSFEQSSIFLEVVSYLNGAGAASGASLFRLLNSADANDYVQFVIDPPSGNIFFQYVENAVIITSTSTVYDATTMRWLRFRETSTTVYFETSPDGATWTTRLTSVSQTWVSSVKALIFIAQSGGAATTKCIDNVNVAPASSRIVPVGSEFTVSGDGKLGVNRCDKTDAAWPYPCTVSAYNALRRSVDPCGLWVQPPAKQFLQIESTSISVDSGDELTIITVELTNPDTCRGMLFYIPAVARMTIFSKKADTQSVDAWALGMQVTGVDNSDSGFNPLQADDIGAGYLSVNYVWAGAADYFWTAGPGESTTVEMKVKAFSSGPNVVTKFQAELGILGMSVIAP